MPTRPVAVIICDDVRTEMTHKDILIGVYSGTIQVGSYPSTMALSLWVEFESDQAESTHWQIRLESPSGNPPLDIEFDLGVGEPGPSVFTLGGLPVHLERDGELVVSFRRNDEEWTVEKRKKIMRRSR